MDRTEERIDRLERLVADLDARVGGLEPRRELVEVAPAPRAAPSRMPRPAIRPTVNREDLEDLVGGRVLAWVGGLAVLLGLVFLFALAVSNGWIGETARVVVGAIGSAGLLALGVWLHESKARTDAALASVATGIAGLFVTITVAAQTYELLPQMPAVVLAVAVGAVATALAIRWESRGIAALGILGALTAPVLANVAGVGGTMVILFVALASAAAVLVWQRWDWLALAAFVVATPQWAAFVIDGPPVIEQLAVLIGFGALGVAVAVGHDVRVRADRLRSSSAYLLALNALLVAAIGYGSLDYHVGETAANAWVAGVAVAHLAVGLGGRFLKITDDLRLLALVLGAVVADVAFALIADGPALAIGWAATGVGFAIMLRRGRRSPAEGILTQAGLGGHLALSLLSAIAVSDPSDVMNGYAALSPAGAAAIAALAAGCVVSARIAGDSHPGWRIALDSIALAVIAALTALTLDGLRLVLVWAVEVVALAGIVRRTGDEVAATGALGFVALAALHALAHEAPPLSLVTGLTNPAAALAALAAVAGCLVLLGAWAEGDARVQLALRAAAAVTVLYLASVLVVTPFESDSAVDSALLSAHQQGQMVLSVFWALAGVGTMVLGLRNDLGALRVAGLALVGVAVGKVFVFDLATLTSVYRVVSLVGLGLLLLAGALVWQRLRPQALGDLRETPAGVR